MKIDRHRNLFLIVAAALFGNLFLLTQPGTFAQPPDFNKQKTDVVEITPQLNSPLLITLTGVDNSDDSLIKLKFTAQNSGTKKIEDYALLLKISESGNSGVISLTRSIEVGQTIDGAVSESKANLKTGSKISLSVDYVTFADGSSWGKDSKHESEIIKGSYEGRKKAILEIKEMLNNPDRTALSDLLRSEIFDIDPALIDKNRPENWQIGFSVSYKAVLLDLQTVYKKYGIEALPSKLEEFSSLYKIVSRIP